MRQALAGFAFYAKVIFWWILQKILRIDTQCVNLKTGVLDSKSKHCHYCFIKIGLPHWHGCPCVKPYKIKLSSVFRNDDQKKRDVYKSVGAIVKSSLLGYTGKRKKYSWPWYRNLASQLRTVIDDDSEYFENVYRSEVNGKVVISVSWVHVVSSNPKRVVRHYRQV